MVSDTRNESLEDRKNRTKKIISILKKTYPKAKISLYYNTSWELLVAVVLSAQCTDSKVNEVTKKLFKIYKTLDDYVNADLEKFQKDIKPTGFYKSKAKHILQSAKIIKERHKSNVPKTMEELTALPGVARKTANIILGNAFKVVDGIAVDTHVSRISQRLRIVNLNVIGGGKKKEIFTNNGAKIVDYKKDASTDKIEYELMQTVPRNDWLRFTYLIISHGRALCMARSPNCSKCPLGKLCLVSRV